MTQREASLRILRFLYDFTPTAKPMVEAVRTFENSMIDRTHSEWVCKECQEKYWRPHDLQYPVKTIANNFEFPCFICRTLVDSRSFDLTCGIGLWMLRKEMESL